MRPLVHPSIEDITVEGILHALSDSTRVTIYAKIVSSECSHSCTAFREFAERPVPKSTLSQHFKALRDAGLIRGERRGNEMHNTSRCEEIERRFPGLIAAILTAHTIQSQEKHRSATPARRRSASRSARST